MADYRELRGSVLAEQSNSAYGGPLSDVPDVPQAEQSKEAYGWPSTDVSTAASPSGTKVGEDYADAAEATAMSEEPSGTLMDLFRR